MKKVLLKTANTVLRPAGVQIYREGMDMESVLKRLARSRGRHRDGRRYRRVGRALERNVR